MEQVNLRLTPEVFSKFKENYDNLKKERKVLTLNEFTELLLDNYKKLPLIIEKEVEKPLNENQVIIEIPEWNRVLLAKTTQLLSEKGIMNISPEKLLLYIFGRYTIEHYSQWFYPFVLRRNEIESLTGLKIEQIERLIEGLKTLERRL